MEIDQQEPVEELAVVVSDEIRRRVPSYASLSAEVFADVVDANRHSVDLYLSATATHRLPATSEFASLAEASARRVRQGIPLEAVLQAYRIGTWTIWRRCVDGMDADELREKSDLTFGYIDMVSTVAERAYTAERELRLSSRHAAAVLFLAHLLDDTFASAGDAEASASNVGINLNRSHVAVVATPPHDIAPAQRDRVIAETGAVVRRQLPQSIAAPSRAGLLAVVPSDNPDGVADIVQGMVDSTPSLQGWVVGIGSPDVGLGGLRRSVEEAQRAAALGAVFSPGSSVCSYAALSFYDLFKTGRTLDDFVANVIGPLVEHDEAKGSALVATLQAYYLCGHNRREAAQQLCVHPNTLDYRLKQVRELLGHHLTDGDSAFRLQLALRLLPLSSSAADAG